MNMTRYILALLPLVLAGPLQGQDGPRPANFDFDEDKRRMDTLIEFPDIEGDLTVMLLCFSKVQPNGKMKDTGCYAPKNYDEPFAMAVNKAAKKARMNPAIIGGKAREIYLQFRAEFISDKGNRTIDFYLNPGYQENIAAYGFDHIAGQREIGRESWMDVCPKRANFSLLARAFLGENGRAESPALEHTGGIMPTPKCQDAIKQTLLNSRYTPAYADGQPVPSSFVEAFGN
jgi:hypothetical protein